MRNNSLTIIMLIIAGLLSGYIYHANVSSEISIDPPLNGRVDDLEEFEDIKIDFSSLEVEKINELVIFGEYPVNPGTPGKRDPFAPF